jgi:excisionase family DNA binding protein
MHGHAPDGTTFEMLVKEKSKTKELEPRYRQVPQRILHSVPEAAQLLGVSARKLHYMIARGEIASVKIGERRLVPISAIVKIARRAR